MNNTKIAFIICRNNETYFEEASCFIGRLAVPKGYEIEILAVTDAVSMCAGYNEGMTHSDAKYKVYMHQDVFIKNQRFLYEVLDVFAQDKKIGMIGIVGGNGMPKTGVVYRAWNEGMVDCREPDLSYYLDTRQKRKQTCDVEAIDGLIMITQYDLAWREDLFDYFDFYDVSQSFEFRKNGYRVVVPYQKNPWVLHDSSFAKLNHYNDNRLRCLKEYPEFLYEDGGYEFSYSAEWDALSEALAQQIKQMMESGDFCGAASILKGYQTSKWQDSTLELLNVMCEIAQKEIEAEGTQRFFLNCANYSQMYEKYIEFRFLLRRVELGFQETEYEALTGQIKANAVSYEALTVCLLHGIIDRKRVIRKLQEACREQNKELEKKLEQLYMTLGTKNIPRVYMKERYHS